MDNKYGENDDEYDMNELNIKMNLDIISEDFANKCFNKRLVGRGDIKLVDAFVNDVVLYLLSNNIRLEQYQSQQFFSPYNDVIHIQIKMVDGEQVYTFSFMSTIYGGVYAEIVQVALDDQNNVVDVIFNSYNNNDITEYTNIVFDRVERIIENYKHIHSSLSNREPVS